jgi:hypothetical protein
MGEWMDPTEEQARRVEACRHGGERRTPYAMRHAPHAARRTPHAARNTPYATRHTPYTCAILSVRGWPVIPGDPGMRT